MRLLLLVIAVMFSFTDAAPAGAASMYQVNNGTAVTINEHGVCRIVTNWRGIAVMVPTNSYGEWISFVNAPPSGVSLGGCVSYSWQVGGWGACPASCGWNTQYRSVWCQGSDGSTPGDAYCGGGKPGNAQSCLDYNACTYAWVASGWGACSNSCGTGTQTQAVYCRRSDGNAVADAYCGGGKPATSRSCDTYYEINDGTEYNEWTYYIYENPSGGAGWYWNDGNDTVATTSGSKSTVTVGNKKYNKKAYVRDLYDGKVYKIQRIRMNCP